ncbi:hypothetical protein INT44_000025 [Umbelopsis vinacea]|uniref:Homeobox domain-containing protein n=1 Tax=Umbelopsis vinacea TaxID=44442 RepID=A0A8H7PH72_9FUNG|nr:hypothetical protein INT44_000025 [Umbelopsis vinacea]
MYSPYMPFFTSQQPRSVNGGYRHDQAIYGDNINLISRSGNRHQPLMKHPYHPSSNSSLPPLPPNGHCGSNNGLMYDFTAAAAAAAAASVNMSTGNDMAYTNLDIDRGVKRRRRLTQEETNLLNDIFERTSKPNALVRKMLAERLNMSPRTVQIWFQNRRAKVKKDGKSSGSITGNDSSPSTSGDSPNSKSDSGPSLSRSTSTSSTVTDATYKLVSQEQEAFTPSLRTDSITSNLSDWSTDCDWAFQTMDYGSPNNSMYASTKDSPANQASRSHDPESDTTGTSASSNQAWPLEFPLGTCEGENYLGIHPLRPNQDVDANKCKQEDLSYSAPLAAGAVAPAGHANMHNPPADWFPECNDPNYLLGIYPLQDMRLYGL